MNKNARRRTRLDVRVRSRLGAGLAALAALACLHAPLHAADGIQTRALAFAKGSSSATVKGTVRGPQTIDYQLRAKAGQTMEVELKSANAGLAFNVLPPGSKDVAIEDAIGRQAWTGALPADGQYTIRTYLPRSAARRGEKADFTLRVGISGAAAGAAGPSGAGATAASTGATALEKATDRATKGQFDATGQVPCARVKGQPMGPCSFGVARAGGGTAVLVVTHPDGKKRTLFFDKGKPAFADLSQADGNMNFRAIQELDLFRIEAGNERYEVPEAAINGG